MAQAPHPDLGENSPPEHPLATKLAPFWSAIKVAAELGMDAEALQDAAAEGRVLALELSDTDVPVFPVAQFERVDGDVRVRPRIQAMLGELIGVDRWTVGLLLAGQAVELDDLSPYEADKVGVSAEALTNYARLLRYELA